MSDPGDESKLGPGAHLISSFKANIGIDTLILCMQHETTIDVIKDKRTLESGKEVVVYCSLVATDNVLALVDKGSPMDIISL